MTFYEGFMIWLILTELSVIMGMEMALRRGRR